MKSPVDRQSFVKNVISTTSTEPSDPNLLIRNMRKDNLTSVFADHLAVFTLFSLFPKNKFDNLVRTNQMLSTIEQFLIGTYD